MQCPICGTELDSNAVVCEKCGATRVTQRTPAGVIAGWLGMLVGILWALLATPLLILPFTEHGVVGYPWPVLVVGGILTVGLLRYSKTTVHATWVRKEN